MDGGYVLSTCLSGKVKTYEVVFTVIGKDGMHSSKTEWMAEQALGEIAVGVEDSSGDEGVER